MEAEIAALAALLALAAPVAAVLAVLVRQLMERLEPQILVAVVVLLAEPSQTIQRRVLAAPVLSSLR